MVRKVLSNKGPFPLSDAVLTHENYALEISGQIGVDPRTGELVEGIEKQTTQTLENIKKILEKVGWNFKNVIKTRVYLSDMANYATMNSIYQHYFTGEYPARVALAVKELP